MKIAIFSDNFYPEMSGISDSIILLSKELAKLGHEICFYVPKYSAKNYRAVGLPIKELALGKKIKIVRLPSLPATFAGAQARLVVPLISGRLFKKFKPDIIHSQLFFGVGLEALALAKFLKLPLIGTNHTAITDFVSSKHFKKPSLEYAIWYYNRCNFVTAPSQSVFFEMLKHDFKQPHQVISNPIDTKIFCPQSGPEKNQRKFNFSDKTVIYAGRLSSEKNIDVVIRAIALAKQKIKDINLAIAGAGKQAEELKQLAGELGLKKQVNFLGALSKENLARAYRSAQIFAIASTSETQSLTLMQAMACGLPAVAVRARALPEYVNEKNGYLVKAGDEKAMAEKFILLLGNKKLCQDLGRGAYSFVNQFSASSIAKKWQELYKKVIKDYNNRP
jgi:1,2-diacylglycerol 3-alpha-glucosyltransferase